MEGNEISLEFVLYVKTSFHIHFALLSSRLLLLPLIRVFFPSFSHSLVHRWLSRSKCNIFLSSSHTAKLPRNYFYGLVKLKSAWSLFEAYLVFHVFTRQAFSTFGEQKIRHRILTHTGTIMFKAADWNQLLVKIRISVMFHMCSKAERARPVSIQHWKKSADIIN